MLGPECESPGSVLSFLILRFPVSLMHMGYLARSEGSMNPLPSPSTHRDVKRLLPAWHQVVTVVEVEVVLAFLSPRADHYMELRGGADRGERGPQLGGVPTLWRGGAAGTPGYSH